MKTKKITFTVGGKKFSGTPFTENQINQSNKRITDKMTPICRSINSKLKSSLLDIRNAMYAL